jgi:signal transduction histidine kinase
MYILLQTLVGRSKFCTGSRPFSQWTSYYYFGAGFSFITSSAQQMSRTYSCWRQNVCNKGILFLAAMTISIIAGSASLLTFGINYGGVCEDIFGVESPAAQWSEWIVSVPLMAYLAVSVEDKLRLTRSDYFVISSLSFAVICGAVMNFKYESRSAGIFLFLLGCFSLVISFFHVRRSKVQEDLALDRVNLNRISDDEIIAESKKIFLTRLICAVFPQFPIIYLFGFFRILNRDQLYVAFVMLSVAAKLLFVSALVDEQIHVTEQIRVHREAETKFNDTRRSFLRYLFHELRTPLNTITLGMAVIENNRGEVTIKNFSCYEHVNIILTAPTSQQSSLHINYILKHGFLILN